MKFFQYNPIRRDEFSCRKKKTNKFPTEANNKLNRYDEATAVELLFNLTFINSGRLASSSFSFTSYKKVKTFNLVLQGLRTFAIL